MLSDTNRKKLALFDANIANQLGSMGSADTLSAAGAVSLLTYHTRLAVSGTMALTLAAPTVAGQKKRISCESAASTPAATLTIADPDDTTGSVCASTFLFTAVGQSIELEATAALKWRATRVVRNGGAADEVVVGTTVLTGINLRAVYYCSVTGTVASTTTKGIPNGSAPGEIIKVAVSTAASTPSGTISLTGLTNAGAAATTLGTMAATTNYATLRWNGTAWELIGNTTLVLSA